jgi:hypothetical protein
MTSSNVTWARQHAKAYTDLAQYSKPLIDGRPENVPLGQSQQSPGKGETLVSKAFAGQGGGYVKLDGSANFGVDSAIRDAAVDMAGGEGVDTVVAIHDAFADDGTGEVPAGEVVAIHDAFADDGTGEVPAGEVVDDSTLAVGGETYDVLALDGLK